MVANCPEGRSNHEQWFCTGLGFNPNGARGPLSPCYRAPPKLPPIRLGNEHAPDRLWPVALFEQFHLKLTEELLHSLRFESAGVPVVPLLRRAGLTAEMIGDP